MDVTVFAAVLGVARVLIGLGPILAPDPLARLFGFPATHITPTMRLFARLFGIRDLGLGALIFLTLKDPKLLGFSLLFNAAHDVLDAAAICVPLLKGQGIQRPAKAFLAFSFSGIVTYTLAWWWVSHGAAPHLP